MALPWDTLSQSKVELLLAPSKNYRSNFIVLNLVCAFPY